MSRNGSGIYSLPVNSWNPAVNGNSATAADWQSLIDDVESALTQSVSSDGQTPITGNLNLNGNKITSLGAATSSGDALRFQQLFSQGAETDIASGATVDIGAQNTNFLCITGTSTITSFGTNYNGPRFLRFAGILTLTHGAALVLPGAANITTAAGDAAIVVPFGAPAAGWRVVAYQRASGEALVAPTSVPAANLTGTVAIANGGTGQATALAGFDALKQAATDAYTGVVELADATEAQALADAVRAITPATLASALKGANQSLAANGYQKLPGGLIIQWGSVTVGNSAAAQTITFPIAFPTACLNVLTQIVFNDTNSVGAVYYSVSALTTTNFTTYYTMSRYWIAIGY